jgi:trehalose/maltose hydrolase-like predicted phosphorylase
VGRPGAGPDLRLWERRPPGVDELTDRTFEAIVFDWDGTAVHDRAVDGSEVRARVEALCAAAVHVFVVSGTHVDNIDGQLRARPTGPGRLHLCLNRGSEVFEVVPDGPELRWRRAASDVEDRALDEVTRRVVGDLLARGVKSRVIADRLNRRKIDLLPDPAWADPPKERLGDLVAAVTEKLATAGVGGLADVVRLATSTMASELPGARVTTDGKHVEIGLTDKSDSARWAAAWLSERGVTGGLILVIADELGPVGGVAGSDSHLLVPELDRALTVSVGVEPEGTPAGVVHLGGGPARFLAILDEQLARRRERRVPAIDDDRTWVVALPEQPTAERAAEAIGTLSNGRAAVRGAREEDGPTTVPLFVVNGVYTNGTAPHLLPGPAWTSLDIRAPGADERLLDLRGGLLARTTDDEPSLRTVRFVSGSRPEAMALRAEGPVGTLRGGGLPGATASSGAPDEPVGLYQLARSLGRSSAGIVVGTRERHAVVDGVRTIERLAAWAADPARTPDEDDVVARLGELEHIGFEQLLAEHRHAWARRWADAEVVIEGSPDDQLAARFAVFHLLGAAPDQGEAAVGARGLTGPAYGGHVFWDADVFVLPPLAAIRPSVARAMLEYRIRRLPMARLSALAAGRAGARFPWESAGDGTDVTPRRAVGRHGELIPILTGEREEHIVADVAWAASEYTAWTADSTFLSGPGRELVLAAARYWASRIRIGADGRGHIDGVMGPDEYHEVVDDDAFTNVMARWNLRRAAELAEWVGGDIAEVAQWRQTARVLVDGWDPERGLYEQFAGYWDLEPLLMAEVAQPPVAADVLLGPARVGGSQLIKQADVLMLHHLVPGEVVGGSLPANLAFYEPRTAHGSSLSPAVHAALYARARQPDRALELFRLAARVDLDDLTGTTAGGLHLASMGGVWQALAYGFLGLRPAPDVLHVDPCLPRAWNGLGLRLRFHDHPLGIRADHTTVSVGCTRPVRLRIAGGAPVTCTPPGASFSLEGSDR